MENSDRFRSLSRQIVRGTALSRVWQMTPVIAEYFFARAQKLPICGTCYQQRFSEFFANVRILWIALSPCLDLELAIYQRKTLQK